ncbi:hypothetical protein [Agathobaculum desmolans]|uniref:hypothetical protein n=1 Tax=Agathobaculum desmolans TaxID=39484 RepID=UPI00248E39F1|nr:hypothetical protein [Agathobaculum desmolans]
MEKIMQPISGKEIVKKIATLRDGSEFQFKYCDTAIAPVYSVRRNGELIIWVAEHGRIRASTGAPADESVYEMLYCERSLRHLLNIQPHDTLFVAGK